MDIPKTLGHEQWHAGKHAPIVVFFLLNQGLLGSAFNLAAGSSVLKPEDQHGTSKRWFPITKIYKNHSHHSQAQLLKGPILVFHFLIDHFQAFANQGGLEQTCGLALFGDGSW